ncbi:hypothetical protein BGZ63DRAFT_379730 [Mariannaea sp. PMI_226]|nr:hypothetical protein BGZ63DRAFT_379730 [Mariannaea sp. PMI_226]
MRLQGFAMAALAIVSSAAPAIAQTTSQFEQFFPAWNQWLLDIIEENCVKERESYQNSTGKDGAAAMLSNCMLQNMFESAKVEMGVASLLLGLLPTILQSVGPSVDEVSILATRRPLLSFVLTFGMPFVRLERSPLSHLMNLREPLDVDVIGDAADKWPWLWIFTSVAEYILAIGAAANIFYLVYQLAFLSVSISAISIYSSTLPKTYPPFLWILLLIPVHAFSFLSLRLGYNIQHGTSKKHLSARKRTWLHTIGAEFTPCARSNGLYFELRKHPRDILLSAAVSWLTNMATLVLFVFGTVFLSSQMFIGLGDMIPVIARVIGSCIIARAVMLFELYGLRRATAGTRQLLETTTLSASQSAYVPMTKTAQEEHTEWQ